MDSRIIAAVVPTRLPQDRPFTAEAQRLAEAFAESRLSKTKLAQKAGITHQTLVDMLEGKRATRDDSVEKVCEALGLNFHWVKFGVGPKHTDSADGRPVVGRPRTASAPDLQPVNPRGIERWLAESSGVLPDERDWLLAVPLPDSHVRYPDLTYVTLLSAYRQMRAFRSSGDGSSQ